MSEKFTSPNIIDTKNIHNKKNKEKLKMFSKGLYGNSENAQFSDINIKYLLESNGESYVDNTDLLSSVTSDKSTQCYFREFGDFWPYLGKMTAPELMKNQRFCFMLNYPQFLRKENRLYLENLKTNIELARNGDQKPIEAPRADVTKSFKSDFESDFQKGKIFLKKDFPNYFQYLNSYYMKKSTSGNTDKKEFRKAIVTCSKQNSQYLSEMERISEIYMNILMM